MAEGYLKSFLNGEAEVHSAGVENHAINENAIKIMKQDGHLMNLCLIESKQTVHVGHRLSVKIMM